MHNPDLIVSTQSAVFERPRPSRLKIWVKSIVNFVGATGMTVATGGYARWIAPFQVEYTQIDMPLRGLPASLEGFRIAQVSDLHTGYSTPLPFLRRVVQQVNRMAPDLVVVTGDLVTHRMEWVEPAADVLAELKAPVIAIYGNHDYMATSAAWSGTELADRLQAELEGRNITVLRNAAHAIERPDGRLWIVGMEDLWSGRFSAATAFASVDAAEPAIALSHNPDTVFELAHYGAQWVLCGHTHGGQIRVPLVGALVLPVRHKRFDLGHFRVRDSSLYITRGVGFRLPVRFRCRPEVPTFTLRRVVP